MSFRHRPVLARRHRPRWQDELRSQQLVVAGFALAIALALGLFGAWAWSSYYDAHLRQVAYAAGSTFTAEDVTRRQHLLESELFADLVELQAQAGTPQDPIIQQQLSAMQQEAAQSNVNAAESLVRAAVQREQAPELGVTVDEARVDSLFAERTTLPLRIRLAAIYVDAEVDEGAQEPSEAQLAAALARANGLLAQLRGGRDFAALARARSDRASSAANGGDLGWATDQQPLDEALFEAAREARVGDLIGPVELEGGYAIVKVNGRREAGRDEVLFDQLELRGLDESDYRAYVADLALDAAFEDHFVDQVATEVQPQRRIAQIFLAEQQGLPVPQKRVRHILVAPIPGQADQSAATEEQWEQARAEAEEIRTRLLEGASWDELAAESDDPGSAGQGGELGWWSPNPDSPQFVPEFEAAIGPLGLGDVSEPVRTQFGWHVIGVSDQRISVAEQAGRLVEELRADPNKFTELAERVSEDPATAAEGGEVGWVARYESDPTLEDAAFAMTEPGAISDPVEVPGRGVYILKLLATSEARAVEADRLEQIRANGYPRWWEERLAMASTWLAPEYAGTALG